MKIKKILELKRRYVILSQTVHGYEPFQKKLTRLLEILTKNEDFMHF